MVNNYVSVLYFLVMIKIYFRNAKGIKKSNLFKRCFINIIISPKKLLTIFMC